MLTRSWMALLPALGGCAAVGPNYAPPKTEGVPGAYHSLDIAGERSRATPEAPADLAGWWKVFGDPTLDSLVSRAVERNLDLHIADERVREARALRGVAESASMPQLDFSAGATRSRSSQNTGVPAPAGDQSRFQLGFDASWEADVFGGIRRSVEAASADVDAAAEARRGVLLSLVAEVARNYAELRTYQERIGVAERSIKSQEETLSLTRSLANAGLTSDLDVAQAEAQLASRRSLVPLLQAGAAQSVHRLSVLLGQEPGALLSELAESRAVPGVPPVVPVGMPSDLLRRRPDIRRAERQVAGATARIGVETAELFPKFTIGASLGLQSRNLDDLGDSQSGLWSLGPGLRWNVFDGGRTRARIEAANSRERQALLAYQQSVLLALEEVENALQGFSREQTRLRELEAAQAANERALTLATDRYKTGIGDFLNVLDSQQRLHDTEDLVIQSRANVTRGLIVLYKALGGGWDPDAPAPESPAAPPTVPTGEPGGAGAPKG